MPQTLHSLGQIQLHILSPATMDQESVALYDRCFALWREIWLPTLKELDAVQNLYSEGFTRQDFVCVLEVNGQLAGLCCFKSMNLKMISHRQDSWFAPWPQSLLAELAESHPRALMPSWLTVAEAFRRSAGFQHFNVALVLSELIGLNCLDLKMDIAFGTPRKDRSVNHLVSQAGADCLLPDILHHGVLVDLVAFYPDKLRHHRFSAMTQILWKNKIDMRHQPFQKEHFYENAL